jgi:F0F1-type ATP synthase delta subunit
MAIRLSRRKIAAFVVDQLLDGVSPSQPLREVAAYLLATRRTREQDLVVREIEDALAVQGIVVADVTSAHSLDSVMKTEIGKLVGAKSLQLREVVDKSVLGGVRIDVPGKRFDGTMQRKLTALKAKQL